MPADFFNGRIITNTHLVKGEDLNHHHTLYAGRCVEWCVQAAYIAAENCFDKPRPLVFMSIRSLAMRSPARLGDLIQITGRVDYVGDSTIGIRVDAVKLQPRDERKTVATGTFLFCTVDEVGNAVSHDIPAFRAKNGAAEASCQQAVREAQPNLS